MRIFHLALCALVLAATLPAAQAAESYASCTGYIDSVPATLSTQGTWCLRKDLSTAATDGAAISIENNNITIDCNDFKIGNLPAGGQPAPSASAATAAPTSRCATARCAASIPVSSWKTTMRSSAAAATW